MPSSSGGGTQTTKTQPWGQAQPYLKDILGQAQQNYQSGGPQYYPDSTVTPELDSSNTALQDIINRGMAGSPVTTAAQNNITDTLNGNYLDPTTNPYWSSLVQGVTNSVTPQVNASFGLAGRTGSGLNQEALAQGLSQGIGQVGAGIYNQERSNQMTAAGLAPTLANQDYVDAGNALGASQQQEGYNQQQLTDAVNRYNFNQNAPNNNLNQYASLVDPIGGMGGSSTTTGGGSQKGIGSSLLGTALVGSNIASSALSPTTGWLHGV